MRRQLDAWCAHHLVCPRDHLELREAGEALVCLAGHSYPIAEGIPVMLRDDVPQTMELAETSLACAWEARAAGEDAPRLYVDTLGVSAEEKREIEALARDRRGTIDPVVAYLVGATNGLMYKHLIGKLDRYPIPLLRLPDGCGRSLLDIGCNWGRWSIAAARKGYQVVGIDPSLGAIMAARRVSESLGLSIRYLVGDARYMPFRAETFSYAFSYSVLQHLSRDDTRQALAEIARTLKPHGISVAQMPTVFGIRSLYHQARRGFRDGEGFEVRYWTISALEALFSHMIGATTTSVDCYFGIGLQPSDASLMPRRLRLVLAASELLRVVSRIVPPFKYVADSVYVMATKR